MSSDCTPGEGCEAITQCEAGNEGVSNDLIIASDPTGSGGKALNCNFKELHFRQPKCNYQPDGNRPSVNADQPFYCVGSRWLETSEGTPRMWICVEESAEAAVWVPWLRWQNTASWDLNPPQQTQVLVVDYHFGVDGEYRRIATESNAPLILVPKAADTGDKKNSAIIHGISGAVHGGLPRGASAVDFQNTRALATQVASGDRSFIAGGQNNTASEDDSYAEGSGVSSTGPASHAEGFSTVAIEMAAHAEGHFCLAEGIGAHAEGDAAFALEDAAHAEGFETGADAHAAHAEGFQTVAIGVAAHAEGGFTRAEVDHSHAEGEATIASGFASHAEGDSTSASLADDPWASSPHPPSLIPYLSSFISYLSSFIRSGRVRISRTCCHSPTAFSPIVAASAFMFQPRWLR